MLLLYRPGHYHDDARYYCLVCPDGYHGTRCDLPCGKCQESTCNKQNGSCSACQPDFALPLCKSGSDSQSDGWMDVKIDWDGWVWMPGWVGG